MNKLQNKLLKAVENNNEKQLRFLVKKGCVLNEEAVDIAIGNDSWNCLAYLLENSCPWDSDSAYELVETLEHFECGKLLQKSELFEAIKADDLELLQCLVDQKNYSIRELSLEVAIGYNSQKCLKYLLHKGCRCSETTYSVAAQFENGCLEILVGYNVRKNFIVGREPTKEELEDVKLVFHLGDMTIPDKN